MMINKNTKVKVRSPNGNTDMVAGVLQENTLAPYLLTICQYYVLRTSINLMKEMVSSWQRKESEDTPHKLLRTHTTAMTALLANSPAKTEFQLQSLERAAGGISLHVNADETEYMRQHLYTILKLVVKFTYLRSSVSSNENDINAQLAKVWTAFDLLLVIWKSDPTDKIKRIFFQAAVVLILLYEWTTRSLTKRMEEKLDGNSQECCKLYWTSTEVQHTTKLQLYGHLPPIRKSIQIRRTRHAVHC